MPAAMSVLKNRLRFLRCKVWMRTWESTIKSWSPGFWPDERFSQQGGKGRLEGDERRREEEKRAYSVYAMPVYATPPSASPWTWMKWMNDGPSTQKRPSSIEAGAVHSWGWVRRQHQQQQQQQQQQRHRRPLLRFLIHTYVWSHTGTHIRPKY